MAQSNDFSTALHSPRVRRVLQTWLHCWGSPRLITYAVHTVSFDWFVSGLEGIIYLEFCYFIFCAKSFNFDQTYLNTGSLTQNVEKLSLDLIFQYSFW